MINQVIINNDEIKIETKVSSIDPDAFWVDLIAPNESEKKEVENHFNIELFTTQKSKEIESSSKYVESEKSIGVNINFLKPENDSYNKAPVSFIITNHRLITVRGIEYQTFVQTYQTIKNIKLDDGDDIFLTIFETRIDYDADLIENLTEQISAMSKKLYSKKNVEQKHLLQISSLRESTIIIREDIFEKQRILFAILKSKFFSKEDYERLRIMIKDVDSLILHSNFNFERLESLQNTFLGMIDMEQNRVIKIFTIVAVLFMPPTLIASTYGMNFKFIPELDEKWGYPFAIFLMLFSSFLTFIIFKLKKWL